MKKILFFALLFLPCHALCFWPLLYEFDGEKRSFLNLISSREEDSKLELIVRPFFLIYERDGKDTVLKFPYPLGRFRRGEAYLFPFIHSRSEADREFHSYFLIFFGREGNERYGGFFPFFGEVKTRFGKERISFFLFPLYGESEYHGTKKTSIIWPFFSIKRGFEEGYKIFPFYGKFVIENVRESKFVLWPFFFKERRDLDTSDPYTSLYILPFFMEAGRESKRLYSLCLLLNLYCFWRTEEREKTSFLWPIFSFYEGEESGLSIFPLIRHISSPTYEERGFFWPFLFHYKRKVEDGKECESGRFLLFSTYRTSEDGFSFSLWPIVDYEEKVRERSIIIPLVFPIDIGSLKRIINPAFSIVEYKEKGGYRGLNILYGLFVDERWESDFRRRLGFLFEVEKRGEDKTFKVFSGLLQVKNDEVKILFLRFRRAQRDTQSEP